MKIDPGMVGIPDDFHSKAVEQYVEMMQLFTEGKLATVPMVNVDGTVWPGIVSTNLHQQVVYGVLFVPPRLVQPNKAH